MTKFSGCSDGSTNQGMHNIFEIADDFEAFLSDVLADDGDDDFSNEELSVLFTPSFRTLKHLFGHTAPVG